VLQDFVRQIRQRKLVPQHDAVAMRRRGTIEGAQDFRPLPVERGAIIERVPGCRVVREGGSILGRSQRGIFSVGRPFPLASGAGIPRVRSNSIFHGGGRYR